MMAGGGQEAHKQLILLLEQAVNQHGEVSPDTIASLQSLANLGLRLCAFEDVLTGLQA